MSCQLLRRGSDVVASGAGNGTIKLWSLKDTNTSLEHLVDLECKGFVNSLAVSRSCRFLVAGVGQEPRMVLHKYILSFCV